MPRDRGREDPGQTLRLVISTHSRLLAVEVRGGEIAAATTLAEGYHYGISILESPRPGPSRVLAYRGGASVETQLDPSLHLYEGGVREGFRRVERRPMDGFGDVHQISSANGGVYVTDTKHNRLAYLDGDGVAVDEFAFGAHRRDENHLNSVFPCGRQVLVMLHNLKRRESQVGVLTHAPGEGFVLRGLLSLWHRNCHNVFVDDRRLFYHASMANELIVVDRRSDRIERRVRFDDLTEPLGWSGHGKGLSVGADVIVAGVSQEARRSERGSSHSVLAVLDRNDLGLLRTIPLTMPGLGEGCGNINEIRCLGPGDAAERGGDLDVKDLVSLRLARKDSIRFLAMRAKGLVLTPLLRLSRRLRVGRV